MKTVRTIKYNDKYTIKIKTHSRRELEKGASMGYKFFISGDTTYVSDYFYFISQAIDAAYGKIYRMTRELTA